MSIKKIPIEELDWDDLKIFLAVVRSGNLSQAAKIVHVDHSTISRRISRLELCLGGALFERRKDGFDVFWVNRQGHPYEEIGEMPTYIGSSLSEVLNFLGPSKA